jgi:hypothetical protein
MEKGGLMFAASQSASSGVFSKSTLLEAAALNASDAFTAPPQEMLLAVRTKPDWVGEACKSLESFRDLPANWDSYGARQPLAASIAAAKVFLDSIGHVVGVDRPQVGVSPAGNVALAWEFANGKRNLDVEVLATGEIRFAYVNEDDPSEELAETTTDPYQVAGLLTQW